METSNKPPSGMNARLIPSTISFEREVYVAMRQYCFDNHGCQKSRFVNWCVRLGLDIKAGRIKTVPPAVGH